MVILQNNYICDLNLQEKKLFVTDDNKIKLGYVLFNKKKHQ